jgi:hypothetical protein
MKTFICSIIAASFGCGSWVAAQSTSYTNFIRQIQFPGGVAYDASVAAAGQSLSQLAIDPGGARFELWTVNSQTLQASLLDTTYVGTYVPLAEVVIRSEDTTGEIPRTRADRPFEVDITISGILSGNEAPDAAKSVNYYEHVQSYGVGGTGIGIDRTQATLLSQSSITANGLVKRTFTVNLVPGADRSKVRGEQRFSVFSLDDTRGTYQAPASQLASQFIQIWPVADGSISGIAQGQLIRFSLPQLTVTANDLYPNSTTYAQVYQGNPQLGVTGTIVPGSAVIVNDSVPQNRILVVDNYDAVFDADGRWTMELLTKTPFGTDRLAYVSFDLDRTIEVNGAVTTIE